MNRVIKFFVGIAAVFSILSGCAAANALTEGYQSSQNLAVGTVVSIAKDSNDQIENTTIDNDNRVVGVIADAKSSIIDVQPKGSNVRVAISGDTSVLVTDIGGNIKKGDYLIISALEGIAMRENSESKATKYIGVAKEDFSPKTSGAQQISVSLNGGDKKNVYIGKIAATVLISDRKAGAGQQSHNFLTSIGERIAGKPVSSLRVIASTVVLISVFSICGWMLNASVRGSFVSLGRNPLAKVSIVTNLMRVIIISLVIFAAGLAASYLLLII